MENTMYIQAREVTPDDIELIRQLIEANPSWKRTRPETSSGFAFCGTPMHRGGQIKDMASRIFLLKLEQRGHITLPRRQTPGRGSRKLSIPYIPHNTASIACALSALEPVHVQLVGRSIGVDLFQCLLSRYYYLGFSPDKSGLERT